MSTPPISPQQVMNQLEQLLADLPHLNLKDLIVDKDKHSPRFGASCEVYPAWSLRHGRKVAVKQIRVFMAKDEALVKRFAKEIGIWATLCHKNVLPLLGYAIEDDSLTPNMVSEWMVNGTLNDYMETIPRCGFQTCTMLYGIASGLAYLHSRGVIHADLKSHNILISADKEPLLADFGMSLVLGQPITTTGSSSRTKGTVRWIARELYMPLGGGSPIYNEMTDMWAFGMVTYELLSGRVPYFDKKDDPQVILAIIKGELPEKPPPECGDMLVYNTLWGLCCHCWTMNPAYRPSASTSMSVLADIEIYAWRLAVLSWLWGYDSSLLVLDSDALTEKNKDDICHALLTFAGINHPEIQALAFQKILSNTVLWPKLQQTLKDSCLRQGESVLSAVSAWKRPSVYYDDEWLRFHHATLRCLSPNPVVDFLGRSSCHYKVGFSYKFEKLILSCRDKTDEMLVLKLIGLNWKRNENEFALYLIKKGYRDGALTKFAIAIRVQIEAVYPRTPLLGAWDGNFDIIIHDFLSEMFKSISFLSDEQCDALLRDKHVRSLWLHVYTIFCVTFSDFGRQFTPEAFGFCASRRDWKAHCRPWHAGSQMKFRAILMELDDIYGNVMRERYPPAKAEC